MPAVPPSGERKPVLRPIPLAAVAVIGLLGAAWMLWPHRSPAPEPAAPAPRVAEAPALPPPVAPPVAVVAPAPTPVAPAPPPPASAQAPPPAPAAAAGMVPPHQPAAAPPAPRPAPAAEAPPPTPPGFDIVRISPRGQAVMAGRAGPGAEVVIRDGGTEIGRVTADAHGQWVLTPDRPLPPGGRELTLATREPDGRELPGAAPVILVVPERGEDVAGRPAAPQAGQALALMVPDADAAPRALQVPATAPQDAGTPPATPPPIPAAPSEGTRAPAAGALGLGVVDYDDGGQVRFSGTAPAGATVRLYVDNTPAGDTRAGEDGRWTLAPAAPVAAGTHTLRLDQMTAQGRVAARVELPFQRAQLPPETLRDGKVVVQPGQSLWRIARARYGRGMQYIVIYEANRDTIRDPDRIYPGQVFDLPEPTH